MKCLRALPCPRGGPFVLGRASVGDLFQVERHSGRAQRLAGIPASECGLGIEALCLNKCLIDDRVGIPPTVAGNGEQLALTGARDLVLVGAGVARRFTATAVELAITADDSPTLSDRSRFCVHIIPPLADSAGQLCCRFEV